MIFTSIRRYVFLLLPAILVLAGCSQESAETSQPTEGTASPATSAPAPVAANVTDDALINAANDAEEWLSYGRDYGETRYSPLNQVNFSNVAELGVAWTYDTGTFRGLEATPLVHNGVMYASGSWSVVFAVDARTGEELWRYDPQVDRSTGWKACCDVVNRGVAIYGDKIFVGIIDGRLEALDAATGEVVWSEVTVDQSKPYTITGAPRVADGKVLIGNGGAELGTRGYLTAYNPDNGEIEWRFWVVPGNPADGFENADMEAAAATWAGDWWTEGGGGNPWDSIIYDPELRLVYVGTGNGSPWSHEHRSDGFGDNLYLSSIVALDVDDGSVVWHYQTTPGDNFDYTAVQPMMVTEIAINGLPRKVVMQAPKNGFFYVLDAETGDLIYADPYAEVTWASGVDLESGRPIETPQARYDNAITFLTPGPSGAHNWHPMSFSPETGLLYVPTMQGGAFPFSVDENYQYEPAGWNIGIGLGTMTDRSVRPDDQYAGGTGPVYDSPGVLVAWDPVARAPRWTREYDFTLNGGTLATAGNLVFQGAADGFMRAYTADFGELVWQVDLGVGIMAAPMTYELDGVQYISVLVGWGGSAGLIGPSFSGAYKPEGRLWTFRLNGGNIIPVQGQPLPELTEIPYNDDPAVIAHGEDMYLTHCMLCHGFGGTSGGALVDLRYAAPATYDIIQNIVREGAYGGRGMPNLSHIVSEEDVDSVKNWLLSLRAGLLAEQ
ncbi:MAG: PQQ-dependent dehydrogenase, methanol/ethanol family [Gammaproteobacteria bacterium]|nr:PQQ-dependent dehydrogenase, methanol/ethanol family [Gammaproteobacteria bacterium]